jgi:hypothetical protein
MNQTIYAAAKANGCTDRLAELLASRRIRMGATDKSYFAKFGRLGDELGPEHLNQVVSEARKHGYTPSQSDVYMPNLAQFPGDPDAFVSPAEGRSKIEKVAAKRGMVRDLSAGRATMKFKYAGPQTDPFENAPPIADDIVMSEIREMARENPDVAKEPLAKLKAEVIKKRSPSKGGKSREIKSKV